jgi:hypothetical protein
MREHRLQLRRREKSSLYVKKGRKSLGKFHVHENLGRIPTGHACFPVPKDKWSGAVEIICRVKISWLGSRAAACSARSLAKRNPSNSAAFL